MGVPVVLVDVRSRATVIDVLLLIFFCDNRLVSLVNDEFRMVILNIHPRNAKNGTRLKGDLLSILTIEKLLPRKLRRKA